MFPWRVCRTGGPPLHFGGAATPVMRAGDTGVMRFDASGFASLFPLRDAAGRLLRGDGENRPRVHTRRMPWGACARARVCVSETQKGWV